VLLHVLATVLKLLHPFMPFVTEALWQAFPPSPSQGEACPEPVEGGRGESPALIVARWPQVNAALIDDETEAQMALVMELVRGIRNLRVEYDVTPGKRIPALIAAGDAAPWLEEQRAVLCALAKLDTNQLSIQQTIQPPAQSATVVVGETVCYLPLAALVDLDAERERLSKELADTEARIARSEALLAGDFAQKAPPPVVQREREKLAALHTEQAKLKERLEGLA
jgi:valyl-tRNA synthetase